MGKRIEWVDCLKGFLILTVIFGHLCTCFWCTPTVWGNAHEMAFYDVIYSFHMPAFFFISGFVSATGEGGKLLSRFFQLVIPSLIISSIFFYSTGGIDNLISLWKDSPVDSRYWFCFILFEVCLTFVLFDFFVQKTPFTSSNSKTIIYIILALGLLLLFLILKKYLPILATKFPFGYIGFFNVLKYTPWLLAGVIAKLQKELFLRIINTNWLMSCIFILYIILLVYGTEDYFSMSFVKFLKFVNAFFAILILFRVFSMSQNFFSSNNRIGRIMVYVGQRTLPIYLVHYFFIEGMRNLSPAFRELVQQNWFFELIIVSAIAIMICGACLAVEKVLQKFPLLHSLAFGFKLKKKA